MFYIDYSYIIFVLPALLLSVFAQYKVQNTFKKYSQIRMMRNYTGAEVAREILDANGLNHIRVERVSGNLTDHYDPRGGVIRLSDSVYDSSSVAAVGVAAHEAGHAVQYGCGYFPIKVRNAILPVANFGSTLSWPLVFLGILLGGSFLFLIDVGILLFSAVVLFQFVTLPVEFNASRRAVQIIESRGIVSDEERNGATKVLRAAALTYVAALAVSIGNLFRLILIRNNRRS